MTSDISPAIIKRTQETLGKYVKKPALSEKLLKKPPFRFLHDVFNVVIRDTGCFVGLYTSEELQFENIKDREDKIKFLQKMIDVVKLVTSTTLAVKPSKIVAGHEAEKTNELLKLMGEIIEKKMDWKTAVAQVSVAAPATATVPVSNVSKTKDKSKEKPSKAKEIAAKDVKTTKTTKKTSPPPPQKEDKPKKVKEKESSKTKPTPAASSKEKPSSKKPSESKEKPSTKKESDRKTPKETAKPKGKLSKTESESKTESSQEQSKQRKLSKDEKDKELENKNAAVPKRKSSKEELEAAALPNLGECNHDELKTLTEPEIANLTIEQDIPKTIETTLKDKSLEVLLQDNDVRDISLNDGSIKNVDNSNGSPKSDIKSERKSSSKRKGSSGKSRKKSAKNQAAQPQKEDEDIHDPTQTNQMATAENNKTEDAGPIKESPPRRESIKPRAEQQETTPTPALPAVPMATPKTEVKRESTFTREDSKDSSLNNSTRPRAFLRPPSARPPSARPGAPRRRDKNVEIVLQPNDQLKMSGIQVKLENFGDLDDDGENLVIIENPNANDMMQNGNEQYSPSEMIQQGEELAAQQGHLVQQILETQKELVQQTDLNALQKSEKEASNGMAVKQTTIRNMNNLRDVIQTITKSVNPLGKLMDFIPEDIDAMQLEFSMWRDTYNQAANELKREKSLTESSTEPMKNQLLQIESNIAEYLEMIDASRIKIVQNSEKILKMLTN